MIGEKGEEIFWTFLDTWENFDFVIKSLGYYGLMKTILGYSSKAIINVLNNIMQSWSRVFRFSKKIYNSW